MFKCGSHFLTIHAKRVLFFAQIQSLLTYGIGAWGNMINTTQRTRLQKQQNQIVHLVEKSNDVVQT